MKKVLILVLIISFFSLNSCSKKEENTKLNKYYDIEKVQTWKINLNNSYISYANWQKEIPLATKAPWRINFLTKQVWDKVKSWELIASVWSEEATSALNTANSIISSLQNLRNSTKKSFDEQIKAALTNLNQIKIWAQMVQVGISWANSWVAITQNTIKKQLDTLEWQINQAKVWIKQAQAWVEAAKAWVKVANQQYETAKTALKELKNVLDWKEKIIYENSHDAVTNSVILYTNILDFADQLLSVTKENKDTNKKFRDYLSAKNKKYLQNAKYHFLTSYNLLKNYKRLYNEKIETWTATKKEIKEILENWKKVALSLKILLKDIYNVLDSSIDNVYFPLAKINNLKNEVSWMWNKIESSLITIDSWVMLWLKWSLQSIDNFDRNKQMQINLAVKKVSIAYEWLQAAQKQMEAAQKQVEAAQAWLQTAKENYETYKEMWKWKVLDIKTKRDTAQKQKELTLDKKNELLKKVESIKALRDAKLKEIDAKIAEAIWQKNQSSIMQKNGKIFSPVNWIITQKMAEIWQVVWAWMPIYMISDNSKIKLKVWIPDEILKNIKVWDKVVVDFESAWKYTWKISSIPNTKNKFTKKTTIEIIVDNNKWKIKVWELAKIYFNWNKTWIIIPNSAIIEKFMIPWVYVIENKKVKFKKIKIVYSSNSISEVEWLKKWEIIVVKGKENLYDWEILR